MMYLIEKHTGKILKELDKLRYRTISLIEDIRYMEGDVNNKENIELDSPDLKPYKPGEEWGMERKNYLFRMKYTTPKELKGKALAFVIETNGENKWNMGKNPQFMMFVNGIPWQGIDKGHTYSVLTYDAKENEEFDISLDGFPGMREGELKMICYVKELDVEVDRLYFNIKVPLEIVPRVADDKIKTDILGYLERTINLVDLRKPYSDLFYDSIDKANSYIESEFYNSFCGKTNGVVKGVGHTHIDVAWLWPISQTRQKVIRSFSTVLNLMVTYPEYLFMSSQPQLYQFIKEDRPDIYEKIKERIKEGRWEPEGGMWLEADCNLASGEAFARQLLYGVRFFREEFNTECKVLWLPDVFGYSAALPQLLKQSHIEYFMTTKIFWNEYNRFPYETFLWEGIDGSSVLSHFITATDTLDPSRRYGSTYNGVLSAPHVVGAWQNYSQKDINDTVLMSFGYGDGGGGPTREMLEEGRRLNKAIPGAPKFEMTKSKDFFEEIESRVRSNKKLPKWVGELYLEYHRGTYTSVGRNKRHNRKCEFLLRDAELFCFIAEKNNLMNYPKESLKKNWETVLLNQFHDILPGSSIKEVYEDSDIDYAKVYDQGSGMLSESLSSIAKLACDGSNQCIVFNQLSFERSDIVKIETSEQFTHAVSQSGEKFPGQMTEDGCFVFTAKVPSMGYAVYSLVKETPAANGMTCTGECMENSFYRIQFDEAMNISSIYDKLNNREVLKQNSKANQLVAFEDKPLNWDAWDINIYYNDKSWEIDDVISVTIVENGPSRAGLRIKKKFLNSVIDQTIYIYSQVPRIDFDTKIDWNETDILLKASFPVDIHTNKATYEIQYGNVERPTHWNTSWDYARFEVSAHKWADISEDGYGVSLLNDCKYGHDIKDSVMRLTLLKSAEYPNPVADKGEHRMLYSLYPHANDFKEGKTVNMAYMVNCPLIGVYSEKGEGTMEKEASFLSLDSSSDNIHIEAVKKSEDGNDLIVRLYECYNRRSSAKLILSDSIKKAYECNILEEELKDANVSGNVINFDIRPFEIKTFKISF